MDLPPFSEVRNLIEQALTLLRLKDSYLLRIAGNERTITGKVACYLERLLHASTLHSLCNNLTVDIEYNRHGADVKKYITKKGESSAIPDIIIHERGTDDFNLAVLEFKKYGSTPRKDTEKLTALTKKDGDYRYRYGFFIEIPVGERAIESPFKITLYEDGKSIETYEI